MSAELRTHAWCRRAQFHDLLPHGEDTSFVEWSGWLVWLVLQDVQGGQHSVRPAISISSHVSERKFLARCFKERVKDFSIVEAPPWVRESHLCCGPGPAS